MIWRSIFNGAIGVVAFGAALNCLRFEELQVFGVVLMTVHYLLYVTAYVGADILRQSEGRFRKDAS